MTYLGLPPQTLFKNILSCLGTTYRKCRPDSNMDVEYGSRGDTWMPKIRILSINI